VGSRKKKILIHSLVFSPDGVSTAYLYNDIALGFQSAGYEVVVLTTTPHYNIVEKAVRDQPMKKRLGGLFYISHFNGIKVIHVPQKKFKSFLARVSGFVFWHLISFLIGLGQRGVSVVMSPSPPLTIGLVSIMIGRCKGAKVIYNVQEIYPDLLINQGKLKSGLVIDLLRKLEKFVYKHVDAVTTIDEIFYSTIAPRVNKKTKLVIIPNFVDTDLYRPFNPHELNLDRRLFPATGNLKLMYAGNIGYAQDWKPLLYLADIFRNDGVSFWVIGEGVLKKELISEIKRMKLSNIHVLPYQSRESIPSLIAYADLQFIFMDPKMDGQGFPSKIYTIMACAKPILVLSGENTPLVGFLHDKHCAVLITSQDPQLRYQELEASVREFLREPLKLNSLGAAGLVHIESQYSKHVVVSQYITLVEKLLSERSD